MHVGPCCSLRVRAYTGVPSALGTWKSAGVGRGRQAGRQDLFTALSPLARYQQQLQICVPAAERLALGFMYCRIVNNL